MNSVNLFGRIARMDVITGEKPRCRFTVAIDRDRENTDFIPCIAFGKTAENMGKYLTKGRQVAVSGSIQTGTYINKEGRKVFATDVIANKVAFGDRKTDNQDTTQQVIDGFEVLDEELPF